ncbi:hypothetical protein C343_03366 [Cryptococcus neoformans C23]|uniref:Uncharacterized protein n=1 Tax=Cryptococcus neoformans (strain H99 / ATCC 208821 / CBS 10515 / FGSC 9487) TaxID=235443 RepID=J9VRM2_CRYN9|nr:hypothetical protein CNAG_07458 [Cryptococcus neoformans var. grubii H99]XP_012049665.1 hypothetical protein, variant [Cryptococcus neoformans var. grubii H99]AUB25052.1 hypothetical protein CKF44_07458 [Cryptococcus neoformans var. grubii]OWZ31864.1 hypothetical protein C347_03429 [Cryptococcus neoformans var. grubii AD2-60a]OWZ43939.1 hypothetical protein C343_03366 [Cryptococcus neoformans var. grubii C23]OXC84588.1 hypothetical protein C344_03127 [Cryptococcus neoformans var. grubii AD1|eukprot:XP_012049664.1 hypothetical protein CNAG_07458 [Cryptococcus neoformans var. grubii H99]
MSYLHLPCSSPAKGPSRPAIDSYRRHATSHLCAISELHYLPPFYLPFCRPQISNTADQVDREYVRARRSLLPQRLITCESTQRAKRLPALRLLINHTPYTTICRGATSGP